MDFDLSSFSFYSVKNINQDESYIFDNNIIPNLTITDYYPHKKKQDSISNSFQPKKLRLDQLSRLVVVPILKSILEKINSLYSPLIYKRFKKDYKFSQFSNTKVKKFCVSQRNFPTFIRKTILNLLSDKHYFDNTLKFNNEKKKLQFLFFLDEYLNKEEIYQLLNLPLLNHFNYYCSDKNYLNLKCSKAFPYLKQIFDYLLKRDHILRSQLFIYSD